jgi:hypothetical protein
VGKAVGLQIPSFFFLKKIIFHIPIKKLEVFHAKEKKTDERKLTSFDLLLSLS